MISALDTMEFKTKGYDCGVDDYIAKPFSARELAVKIKSLLKRKEEIACLRDKSLCDIILKEEAKEVLVDGFKHTPDGVFVDKLSGDILFDTRDRFNSGSGWLSFFKAVDGSVVEREDNSYGMHRVEIIAKKSGIHLGHVFNDAPEGRKRFCINATVLDFVPRDKI